MTSIILNRKAQVALLGVATAAFLGGCSTRDHTEHSVAYTPAPAYTTYTPAYRLGTTDTRLAERTDNYTDIRDRRVDITDDGPGTPRGDGTSADPSETSTQGAGSRALVGRHDHDRYASGGSVIVENEYPTRDTAVVVVPGEDRFVGGSSRITTESSSSGAFSSSSTAITDVSSLRDMDNLATMSGRTVRLTDAKVRAVVDPYLIALDTGSDKPVYVRLHQPISNLTEGAIIRVNGTLRRAAEMTGLDKLTGDAAHVLSSQQVFVDAQTVQVIPRDR